MVTIKKVETRKDIRDFINFPLKLYKGNEYFVPMFYGGEKNIFKKDYPFNKVCDTCFFLAYEDGKVVGRIQGIIQTPANEKWNQRRVRFTRFDCINNQEVANMLFDSVVSWAKDKGMSEFVGPLGYSDLEREGLLIEGFDQPQTYEEQYNFPYYQELIEGYGFTKDVDWVEFQLRTPEVINEKLIRVGNLMLKRYELRLYQAKTLKEYIRDYVDDVFDLIDKCYSRLYGTMPLNEEIVAAYVKDFKLLVRVKDLMLILDKNNKPVGFALMFPSISDAVRKSNGHITLPFLIRFLKAKKNPKVIDLGLIGVLPEYESRGVASAMIGLLVNYLKDEGFDHLETNLMLENNAHIQNTMKNFDKVQNKRRRCFKMDI